MLKAGNIKYADSQQETPQCVMNIPGAWISIERGPLKSTKCNSGTHWMMRAPWMKKAKT